MFETLISLLGGGALRVVPEILGLLNKKSDNAHELAMLAKQVELEQVTRSGRQTEVQMQGDIDQVLASLKVQGEALTAQGQKSDIKWVDALNTLVRPLTTYYFLGMYGVVKLATLVIACRTNDPWVVIVTVWTKDDIVILSGILSFWFVGRVFDKQK